MDSVYISDYIMFNKNCNITLDQVDRILPYIKFKQIDSETYQIDGFLNLQDFILQEIQVQIMTLDGKMTIIQNKWIE